MSVDYSIIRDAIGKHCPRRARHLCKIYAEEHCDGTKDDFERIYKDALNRFGLAGLV